MPELLKFRAFFKQNIGDPFCAVLQEPLAQIGAVGKNS
jgi:hypothetical protein